MEESCRRTSYERPYVMKKHWATRLHYDLRLEWNGVLLSWALPAGPSCQVGEARTAIEMEDHKRANLLFEGVHETGPILVWDRGTWEPHLESDDMLPSLERGLLRFTVRGEKLQGIWTLAMKDIAKGGRRAVWTFRKEADLFHESSARGCVMNDRPNSICTGRTMEEIVRDWNKARERQPSLFG